MFKKLHISLAFSNLVLSKSLSANIIVMYNFAKQPEGFFTRMAAKVAAFTMMQYSNFLNHKPIGQVKYALF